MNAPLTTNLTVRLVLAAAFFGYCGLQLLAGQREAADRARQRLSGPVATCSVPTWGRLLRTGRLAGGAGSCCCCRPSRRCCGWCSRSDCRYWPGSCSASRCPGIPIGRDRAARGGRRLQRGDQVLLPDPTSALEIQQQKPRNPTIVADRRCVRAGLRGLRRAARAVVGAPRAAGTLRRLRSWPAARDLHDLADRTQHHASRPTSSGNSSTGRTASVAALTFLNRVVRSQRLDDRDQLGRQPDQRLAEPPIATCIRPTKLRLLMSSGCPTTTADPPQVLHQNMQ